MKRTPWFKGNVNPVREGWYEVRLYIPQGAQMSDVEMMQWDGRHWRDDFGRETDFGMSMDCWRGLTEKYQK